MDPDTLYLNSFYAHIDKITGAAPSTPTVTILLKLVASSDTLDSNLFSPADNIQPSC